MKPLSLLLIPLLSWGFAESKKTELNVSAAASLRPALEECKPLFEASSKNATLVYNFGSSGALSQQILNGARVDVFLSANPKQVFSLASAGLVRSNEIRIFLRNTLALVVPKGSAFIKNTSDLTDKRISKIALGEPKSVPAGQYALETLASLKLDATLKDKFVFAKDVSQVLTYVESANADAGFVYLSDAVGSTKVLVAVKIEAKLHGPIEYAAAPIQASAHFAEAIAFLSFLRENAKARETFSRRGFFYSN